MAASTRNALLYQMLSKSKLRSLVQNILKQNTRNVTISELSKKLPSILSQHGACDRIILDVGRIYITQGSQKY